MPQPTKAPSQRSHESPRRAVLPVWICAFCICGLSSVALRGQSTRLAILQAEDRRAPTPRDLAVIRAGLHGGDEETTRIAVRALGRLERPALVADIIPSLKSPYVEVRAEAANAIGQALQGLTKNAPRIRAVRNTGARDDSRTAVLGSATAALGSRLAAEADPSVRSAICETLGRLPYTTTAQVDQIERTLLDAAARNTTVVDRLGVAQGLYGLVRLQRKLHPPTSDARARLATLVSPGPGEAVSGARVRRVAAEALVTAGAMDAALVRAGASDPDAQVRRIVMRAAAAPGLDAGGWEALTHGLADESAAVRLEAVRGIGGAARDDRCQVLVGALKDRDTHVDLTALDQLARCGSSEDAVAALVRTADDLSQAGSPRGWHRAAHAIVALASASPAPAATALGQFTSSSVWQLRMYAARAAAVLKDRPALEKLARDDNDNVVEAAIDGLSPIAGHADDALYVGGLSRSGYQAIRASARALDGAPNPDAVIAALQRTMARLAAEGRDNGHDARDAVSQALASLGASVPPAKPRATETELSAEDLRRLASTKARVTIRGIGTFELALFTMEAPATVVRFAKLAESGFYNGLTFHRVVPNFVIQGGSPGANELVGDAMFMRDELGLWPHVRGAVGISTRGRDTGDAQIFVDLVDNPRLDHDYTVFAQVLNGMDVVDQILEGDVIERIDILTS